MFTSYVIADQPLNENSTARGVVGGGLIVIRYLNTRLKSFRTPSLNSEGMLRGTDNLCFILIAFSFKLELVNEQFQILPLELKAKFI